MLMAPCVAVAQGGNDDIKENDFNPVNTGVTTLGIAPDARSTGMGYLGAATDPDVNSQYWNPSKYAFGYSQGGLALSYTPWLRKIVNDIFLAELTGFWKPGSADNQAISASFRYFSLGEVITLDESMTVNPYEMSLDVAYSLMLSEHFSMAAALRWIYSDLRYDYSEDSAPASAFAADLAMYYNNYFNMGSRECQLGIGLNISNIGSKISYYGDDRSQFLPANMRLGLSLLVPVDEYNRFSINADANKLLVPTVPRQEEGESSADYQERVIREYSDVSAISGIFKSFGDAPGGFKEALQEIQWSVGAEYVYHDQFSLRAGYHHESQNKGNRKYFTVGGGFRMNVFSLDVGYVISTAQSNPLDQTLRFTLAFDMDGIKDLFRR